MYVQNSIGILKKSKRILKLVHTNLEVLKPLHMGEQYSVMSSTGRYNSKGSRLFSNSANNKHSLKTSHSAKNISKVQSKLYSDAKTNLDMLSKSSLNDIKNSVVSKSDKKLKLCCMNFDLSNYITNSLNQGLFDEFNIDVEHQMFSDSVNTSEVTDCLDAYNNDASVNGVYLPENIPSKFGLVKTKISQNKDVNCMNDINFAALAARKHKIMFYPVLVSSCLELIKHHCGELEGKTVAVVCDSPQGSISKPDINTTKQLAINLFLALTKENTTCRLIYHDSKRTKSDTFEEDLDQHIIINASQNYDFQSISSEFANSLGRVFIDLCRHMDGDLDGCYGKTDIEALVPIITASNTISAASMQGYI